MRDKTATEAIVAKFLNDSFRDIHYSYEGLTAAEKELCTEEEFKSVIEWMSQRLQREAVNG